MKLSLSEGGRRNRMARNDELCELCSDKMKAIDGYALIEFNTEGNGRIKEIHYLDNNLTLLEIDDDEIYLMFEEQLPDFKDVLVMVFFTHQSIPCGYGDYWRVEYTSYFKVDSFTIVRTDYKEFYRRMVTEEIQIDNTQPFLDLDEDNYYNELISSWEEFYNEEFKPFKKPEPPKITDGLKAEIERLKRIDDNK
jgi:hypothetical protein